MRLIDSGIREVNMSKGKLVRFTSLDKSIMDKNVSI